MCVQTAILHFIVFGTVITLPITLLTIPLLYLGMGHHDFHELQKMKCALKKVIRTLNCYGGNVGDLSSEPHFAKNKILKFNQVS